MEVYLKKKKKKKKKKNNNKKKKNKKINHNLNAYLAISHLNIYCLYISLQAHLIQIKTLMHYKYNG